VRAGKSLNSTKKIAKFLRNMVKSVAPDLLFPLAAEVPAVPHIYALGSFRLDTANELLFRGTEPVVLGRRAVGLLRALIERPGVVVSKDALIEAAWPGQIVGESNLSVQIGALRRALGSEPGGERWIDTLPRRGYRFVGPIAAGSENSADAAPPMAGPWAARSLVDYAPARHEDAERRQITALCCELVGIAAPGGCGLEDLWVAVTAFQRRLAAVAARHGGRIASRFGNAVLVLFGWPAANEDDVERAVRAGLELCAPLNGIAPGANGPMQCRIGIATGMALIADPSGPDERRDCEIFGDAADLALQLQLSAQPGTAAIGPATRRLIANLFDCRELAAIDANGAGEPIRCWQVLGEGTVASRFEALHPAALTPLVGRGEEIELLLRRWRRATSGEGQAVMLSGEPGIGKSRLAAVLLEQLADAPHTRLRCFCSPYHAESALYPTIAQLARAAGFAREDSAAAKREKLEALLAQSGATAEEAALFAELLSLPAAAGDAAVRGLAPRQKKERIFTALLSQLAALTQRAPVLMLFEDAHWADPSSCELLDRVVERIARLPVLLVVTYRPEYRPPWTGLPHVASLALARLGRRETVLLAEEAAGGKPLPDEVLCRIADHADGVPLHVEELTRSIVESGVLRADGDRWLLDGVLPPLAVPPTLQASLAARLDRVAAARPIAEIGAAIGRQFSYELVQAVCGLAEPELQAALARLVAARLLSQRGTPPDAVYSFKHALVQDAAYAGLLRDARRQLHAQIADALEACDPGLADSQPELLAQHYTEAGSPEKSVAYWSKAGHRAASRSAMAEAAAHFRAGLDQLALLTDTPERQWQELEFWSALGTVLRAVKGQAATEAGQAYARARELWEQLDYPSEFLRIPHALSLYHMIRGELHLALRLDEELLHLSRQREDSAGLVLSHHSSGRNLMVAGRLAASRSHLEAGLAVFDPNIHSLVVHQAGTHSPVSSQAVLGLVLFCLGFPDQALARSTAAIAEARRLGHSPSLAGSLAFGAKLLSLGGDNAMLGDWVDQLVAVATEQGFPFWGALGTIYHGWIKVKNGDVAVGISLLRRGSIAYLATGAKTWAPHHISLLARACEIVGQIEEAMALLDDALLIADRTGERWFAAELHRYRGQLLLRQGDAEAAERLYRKALSIAGEQEAKLWELRAATSLARLWGEQGRRGEARELLAPVYGWFTEGFDTADLKEAKALLDQLA
jgi:DNA-binding winged helix-turn-helix (wHTH) protein/predicted ATPase